MKRRFSYILICVVIGIVVGYVTGYHLSLKGVGLLFILLFLYNVLFDRNETMVVGVLFVLLGSFVYGNVMLSTTIFKNAEVVPEVIGSITQQLRSQRGFVEYEFNLEYVMGGEGQVAINEKALLRLTQPMGQASYYQPGDWIKLSHIKVKNTLDGESLQGYDFYLKGRGYQSIIETNGNQTMKLQSQDWNLRQTSDKMKKSVEYYFDDLLAEKNSRLIKSIIFGNQGYLSREELDLFSKAGTAHIIAVSGLHVGLFVLLIQETLRILGMGRNQTLLITAIIILFYGYLVNFPVSIIRASSMYYLYLLAYFLRRRYDSINMLCLVAVILLIINPLQLFSISFQLSFVATLSILLLYKPICDRLGSLPKKVKQLMAITLAAQIGTIPIIAYHFQQVSVVSLLTNIAIVPILAPLLIVALCGFAISFISFGLSQLIAYSVNGLLSYIFWIMEGANQIPFSSLSTGAIDIFVILCYYLILTAIRLNLRRKEIS
ncbi:ComEC/Rec2-related protein [Alkaliphilus metalliredigens QYMF]|uniref:ComEC/Rec2-related protein n=1 Tax=Alkaliphilus metalliredigens (strain QYMF) TaxID=293826 RepID=A6TSN0_ALKMQ|nr:ComEC/Rec2 family competence protein [Alkaliphilus metalliredigens]ABR49198.1 ComEC/Rec2-related protein [Alkaliphilus metalliredigens QYMF]